MIKQSCNLRTSGYKKLMLTSQQFNVYLVEANKRWKSSHGVEVYFTLIMCKKEGFNLPSCFFSQFLLHFSVTSPSYLTSSTTCPSPLTPASHLPVPKMGRDQQQLCTTVEAQTVTVLRYFFF